MIEVCYSTVKWIYVVKFNHFFDHVFHIALLLFVYLDRCCDLIDLLHQLDQLGRAQFYNFTKYYGYLAIIRIENRLPLGPRPLYHIIEDFRFEIN